MPNHPTAPWPTPLVIGHRGAPGYLPDHTLEGYRLAAELGADVIEPDLVISRDGVLVARHENDLTHTTDVSARFPDRKTTKVIDGVTVHGWFAEDFTLAELKQLRAVQPYPDRPHAQDGQYTIPTFDEVLALRAELSASLGRTIGVYPETKHPTALRAAGLPLEPPLIAALQAAGLTGADDPVFVQSFEPDSLRRVGLALDVRRVLLIGDLGAAPHGAPAFGGGRTYGALLADLPSLVGHVHGVGVHTGHVWGPEGPNDVVERAHAAGLRVHVYTFRSEPHKLGHAAEGDPKQELRRFFELGVDGVFADYPDVAAQVRQERAAWTPSP